MLKSSWLNQEVLLKNMMFGRLVRLGTWVEPRTFQHSHILVRLGAHDNQKISGQLASSLLAESSVSQTKKSRKEKKLICTSK